MEKSLPWGLGQQSRLSELASAIQLVCTHTICSSTYLGEYYCVFLRLVCVFFEGFGVVLSF